MPDVAGWAAFFSFLPWPLHILHSFTGVLVVSKGFGIFFISLESHIHREEYRVYSALLLGTYLLLLFYGIGRNVILPLIYSTCTYKLSARFPSDRSQRGQSEVQGQGTTVTKSASRQGKPHGKARGLRGVFCRFVIYDFLFSRTQ